ncbi:unnamed protein product [Oikopleura dioica]|uniref:Uncharacterized protein n=1 Tax=Oikopleura dioica TaxID=34765 RepID=E4XA15_OIKDI|nr:unnamed protein product [Oikopleura dioica]
MAAKGLAAIAAVGDGRVKTEDLANRAKLKMTLKILLASASTSEISADMIVGSVWNWRTDRRTGHVYPDYGIPTSYNELEAMVREERLNGRWGVENNNDSYMRYLTSGAFTLSKKNWVTHRNPLASQAEMDKEGERVSSEFFEKQNSKKKTTAELYREAARISRDTMTQALSGEQDEIVTLRLSVEKGSSHGLEHFLATATFEDGTETSDGERKMLKTVDSLRRLIRLDPSKISVERIAMSFLEEFQLNLTNKENGEDDEKSSKNLEGRLIRSATDEIETQVLSRLAVAFALIKVKDEVITTAEHEFNAKTAKGSTPANFRDNVETYVTTVNREIAKIPRTQRSVRIVNEISPKTPGDSEHEEVARVSNGKGQGRKWDKKPQGGKFKSKGEESDDGEKSETKKKLTCKYCFIRVGKHLPHPSEKCRSKEAAKEKMLRCISEDEKNRKDVKTIKSSGSSCGRRDEYDPLGNWS